MGVGEIYGCGCKEVYRFPHTTYPTPLVSVIFCSSIPTFCPFLKCFSFFYIESVSCLYIVCNNNNKIIL